MIKTNRITDNRKNITIKESKDSCDHNIFDVSIDGTSHIFTRIEQSFQDQNGYKTDYAYVLKDPFGGFWWGIAETYPDCEVDIYDLCRVERKEVVVTKIEVIWDEVL